MNKVFFVDYLGDPEQTCSGLSVLQSRGCSVEVQTSEQKTCFENQNIKHEYKAEGSDYDLLLRVTNALATKELDSAVIAIETQTLLKTLDSRANLSKRLLS